MRRTSGGSVFKPLLFEPEMRFTSERIMTSESRFLVEPELNLIHLTYMDDMMPSRDMVYIHPEVERVYLGAYPVNSHVYLKHYLVKYHWPDDQWVGPRARYYYPRPQLLYPQVVFVPEPPKAPTPAPECRPSMPRAQRRPAGIPIIDPETGNPVIYTPPPSSSCSSSGRSTPATGTDPSTVPSTPAHSYFY